MGRFSVEEEGKDKTYHLLNDDEYIWSVLKDAKAAEAANPVGWHENRGNFVSFIVTSEAFGVYKKVMYITESGYVWTNAFDGEYLYYIGEDAAGNIIKYAKENSTVAEFEPFNKSIAGKVTEITDDYILVDDSVLCKDPADGITYKIMIDDVKISLAVSNLIENAIKYNVDNGWVRVSLNADHKYFYVKVADSGVGIPEDCQSQVFERFYRVDKARSRDTGGTGLGLSITRNAILMHKGAIKLYSKPGEGTTFTMRIPLTYTGQVVNMEN